MKNKTPRTDDREFAAIDVKPSSRVVYASFARQLETELADKDRQLAEARAEIERLNTERRNNALDGQSELDELHNEIKRKDKLIEQMRSALKALRKYPNTYIATGQGAGIAEKDLAMCDAALAAERGEG